ncbi:MAG: tRNA adenosine(34) deaminase TadA [Candidatus Algichlamydia australiensis]|nr:tRNA adenosine(34) deaminase TadA [Chlamydiales bacterium]
MDDKKFMEMALKQAKIAFTKGEVPVGAIVVHQGKVISRAHNGTEEHQDATLHAELMAIRRASAYLKQWRLTGATLYTTLEPCVMCAGALLLSRVDRLVYGAKDFRHGGDGSLISLMRENHPIHTIEIASGVCKEESAQLLRTFFKERRDEKRDGGTSR